MSPAGIRRWLAVGSGIGVEIAGDALHIVVAKVRPTGIRLLGSATIENFRRRPAAEWGAEYSSFIRKKGAGHLAATVLLPREEVIVRQMNLPGVADKDLENAIRFQVDSLHPFPEDEAMYSAARVGRTATVLVGIARRDTIEQYASLFAEAGVKVASFTFSAAAIYSAIRLITMPRGGGFIALQDGEAYGESESRPVFSAAVNGNIQRAISELRLPPDTEPAALVDIVPFPLNAPAADEDYRNALAERALPYTAALAGACPRLGLSANLLPPERRAAPSRWIYMPTVALLVILVVVATALAVQTGYDNRRYAAALEQEVRKLEPRANRIAAIDRDITNARARTRALDEFRRRSKADMDALNELTQILPPPIWLTQLELTRSFIHIAGEAEQAAPLLRVVDESKLFVGSEFTMPLARVSGGEAFRIRAQREGAAQ